MSNKLSPSQKSGLEDLINRSAQLREKHVEILQLSDPDTSELIQTVQAHIGQMEHQMRLQSSDFQLMQSILLMRKSAETDYRQLLELESTLRKFLLGEKPPAFGLITRMIRFSIFVRRKKMESYAKQISQGIENRLSKVSV
jgi:hypothetical protein